MNKNHLTLEDVAREVGVSTYVVSMALRGRRGVAATTRERVAAVAERLGYRANGAAAYLARQRSGRSGSDFLVGYVVSGRATDEDFLAACAGRGWQGVMLGMGEWGTPEQAAKQVWRRGIDGLLLGAGSFSEAERETLVRFDWGKFPAVKMSRALPELPFHLVRHSAFDYMITALETVWARGFRQLAVVLHHSSSVRDDQARHGAMLAFTEEHAGEPGFRCVWRRAADSVPGGALTDPGCVDWIRRNKVQVVVLDHWVMGWELMEAGLRVPSEAGLAAALTDGRSGYGGPGISGCDQRGMERYRTALDILAGQILNGQRGFVPQPLESVVEPVWFEGETLPLRMGETRKSTTSRRGKKIPGNR